MARANGVRLLNVDAVFYRAFRYPAEIISHCVWLYYRFQLSFWGLAESRSTPMAPISLVTTFLLPGNRDFARHSLHLKVTSLDQRGDIFGFNDHLEQVADLGRTR